MLQSGMLLDESSRNRLLQIKKGCSKFPHPAILMSEAQIRRTSVLHFAEQVSCTGLGTPQPPGDTGDPDLTSASVSMHLLGRHSNKQKLSIIYHKCD